MKIEYYLDNEYYCIELGKTNLFIKSVGGGKTAFCDMFSDGLSAKGKYDFVVNGVNADKTMFNVTYIDEKFEFDDYLKFKVRGNMFKDFKNNVLEDYEDELNVFLLKLNEKVSENNFADYYKSLNDNLNSNRVILNSGINSIEDIYEKLFSLIFDSEVISMSSKIETVIKHMILFGEKGKSSIIIIDDYMMKMGREVLSSILKLVNEIDNVYVIFTSSYYLCVNEFSNVFLKDMRKINLDLLYKKMFVYDQWNKEGDFNSFFDSNISLVEENDLNKYRDYINEYELLFYNVSDLDEFIEKALSVIDKIKL